MLIFASLILLVYVSLAEFVHIYNEVFVYFSKSGRNISGPGFLQSLNGTMNICIYLTTYLHFHIITKTCLFKYTENFTTKKWKIFI